MKPCVQKNTSSMSKSICGGFGCCFEQCEDGSFREDRRNCPCDCKLVYCPNNTLYASGGMHIMVAVTRATSCLGSTLTFRKWQSVACVIGGTGWVLFSPGGANTHFAEIVSNGVSSSNTTARTHPSRFQTERRNTIPPTRSRSQSRSAWS